MILSDEEPRVSGLVEEYRTMCRLNGSVLLIVGGTMARGMIDLRRTFSAYS